MKIARWPHRAATTNGIYLPRFSLSPPNHTLGGRGKKGKGEGGGKGREEGGEGGRGGE